MNDIGSTALMFARQAAKYSDPGKFEMAEAFDVIHDTIAQFEGKHFESARARSHLVEALNLALSSVPGNQVALRCAEFAGGTHFIEWLPFAMPAEADGQ
jgi:hypothetical protein